MIHYVEFKFKLLDSDHYLTQFFSSIQFQSPSLGAVIALIIALILLFASGFISASEIAFFSLSPVDKNRIEEEEHESDSLIKNLLSKSQHLLATILIANNFVNVAVIILMTFFLNSVFFDPSPVVSFVIQTVLLTFLLLLIGEIMPKIYSSYNPLKFARMSAYVLQVLRKIFYPFSSLLVYGTGKINKRVTTRNNNLSLDDLSQALELTSHELKEEKSMLDEFINLVDTDGLVFMTSRVELTSLEITSNFDEVMQLVVESNYSRIPVYENTEDHIGGI